MRKSTFVAVFMMVIALTLAIFSVRGDAITTDESPHISSGYSYLSQRDMRLNPEHPPLMKDLAALPLLFKKINFDAEHSSWRDNINDQWSFGSRFLYDIGNDPDKIAFASRMAVMIIFVFLGWIVFKWAREKYGAKYALIALALTVFSPNILAHGRYVTTDVGAAFAFIFALYFFIKFLITPSKKHLLFAGLAFGLAQLLKFSLFLLVPFYIVILGIFYFVKTYLDWQETPSDKRFKKFSARFFKYFRDLAIIFVIGYLLIWPVYQFHVWNYPAERQKNDTAFILDSSPLGPVADAIVWMADKPILRPYAQYMLGLAMVFQRTGGGNTTYFMGEVSSTAWKSYFPTVYILKEPLPFLILLAGIIVACLFKLIKAKKSLLALCQWIKNNFTEFTWLSFVIFYWFTSLSGNLNIGLRHVLPTFPFIYLLSVWQIKKWQDKNPLIAPKIIKPLIIGILLIWYFAESVLTFPFYLSYYNELAGGPNNGYKYAVDSNLDWGQDLKRLSAYVKSNPEIKTIKVDYFGGGNPRYYLGDQYAPLNPNNPNDRQGWLAISATLLQGGRAQATKGYDRATDYYRWLDNYKPITKIGYSIFIYNIE